MSLTFLNIPQEIRNEVWEFAIGDLVWISIASDEALALSVQKWGKYKHYIHLEQYRKWVFIENFPVRIETYVAVSRLLSINRQSRTEVMAVLYSQRKWIARKPNDLLKLCDESQDGPSVKHIDYRIGPRIGYGLTAWQQSAGDLGRECHRYLSLFQRFRGLQSVMLEIEITFARDQRYLKDFLANFVRPTVGTDPKIVVRVVQIDEFLDLPWEYREREQKWQYVSKAGSSTWTISRGVGIEAFASTSFSGKDTRTTAFYDWKCLRHECQEPVKDLLINNSGGLVRCDVCEMGYWCCWSCWHFGGHHSTFCVQKPDS